MTARKDHVDELIKAASKLYEFRNLVLSISGAAGHRCTDTDEWVCDPWTQAFKDLKVALDKIKGGLTMDANQISAEFGEEWGLREWAPLHLDGYAMELCTY